MQGSSHCDVILFTVSPLHVTLYLLYLRLVNLFPILAVANQELLNVSFSLPAGLYQENKRPKTYLQWQLTSSYDAPCIPSHLSL